MSLGNFAHLIEARLYQDPALSKAAAHKHTDEDMDRLENALENARESLNSSRKKTRLQNVRFHHEVARISRNPILLFISESIPQTFVCFRQGQPLKNLTPLCPAPLGMAVF
ncbi:MAG: FCD domain-containing protein [Desulfarculaceae bacterium]|nr:FCD domain-containing protein [Desulfarculaceae bacterium]MCF8071110.1 FCD domain-containing protein [Desulfarculaceae bacterium]MCF8101287.1 FCD domain-containing protein [Desulfarculaceae bacterium]MCF8115164.1 FCD domain-containing protein [Desulfarculaceae bacterium]